METPYIDELKQTLSTLKQLLELLSKASNLIVEEINKNNKLSELEITMLNINLIDTNARIETLKKVFEQKTEYFEKYAANFEIEYKEMVLNYDKVMDKAEKVKFKVPAISNLLNAANKEVLQINKEAKLFFYKKIKGLLP